MLDFQMPKMNGIQVLQRIRYYCQNFRGHPEIKIEEPTYVFLTAFKTITFSAHLKSLGVEMQFEKPLSKDQLERILNQCQVKPL